MVKSVQETYPGSRVASRSDLEKRKSVFNLLYMAKLILAGDIKRQIIAMARKAQIGMFFLLNSA